MARVSVGPSLHHVVEERLVAADALGDDAQEAALQVGDRVVELVEHLGDAGHGLPRAAPGPGTSVGNLRFNGWPAGIGVAQLSISFQSGTSLDAAVSTSSPV